jgi:High potential iron-sulfur protein
MTNRRQFVINLSAASALLSSGFVTAQTKLDEKDPQAAALGYVADTTKADSKKFPKHSKDQKCTNCQLYAGKATDPVGGCPIFAGKQVAGPGWCSAWVKKA